MVDSPERSNFFELVLSNSPISFAHAFSMRTFNILFDDLFPPSSAQPSPEEALHLLDLTHFNRVLDVERCWVREYETVFGLSS